MRKLSIIFSLFLLLFSATSFAQTMQVTGTVKDANDGSTLPGAYVVVKGTTNGGIVDNDGKFSIVCAKDAILVITFVGYQDQEVAVNSRSTIEVSMLSVNLLDEVVVTALGVSRQKKALGYAVQNVGGDELTKVKTPNILSSLSGKVAGVQITTASGQMGGGVKINIRGNTSLTGNNQPLFVVDGVPISNKDFSYGATGGGGYDLGNLAGDINPDDVESMTLLKGASASALYGSRAANGVILVTTKKAKKDNTWGVSVNSSATFDKAAYMPKYQKEYGGGLTYNDENSLDGFMTADIGGKKYRLVDYATDESWGPKYNPNLKVLQWNAFDEWDTDHYMKETPWIYPKNDYTTYYQTGYNVQNNIQLSKAGDWGSFRLSYTNNEISGITPNSKMHKHNFNVSGNANFSKWLDGWATMNYLYTEASGRPETGYGERNPAQKMWQWIHTSIDYKDLRSYLNPDGSQRSWNRTSWSNGAPAYTDNPFWSAYKNYQSDSKNRLFGNAGLNVKFTDYLKLTGRVGIDWYNFRMDERSAVGSQDISSYYLLTSQAVELNMDLFLSFNKRFANDLVGISAMIGTNSMNQSSSTNGGETVGGLVIPNIYVLTNSSQKANIFDSKYRKKTVSVFGNATFDYAQIVYLDITARNDWSSSLPAKNRSYFYPSVNLSFVLTGIDALQNSPWLTFAKVRGGWAQVGNDTDSYNLINYYAASTGGAFDGNPRYNPPTTLSNPELRPEKTSSWEVGLEASFFDSRLGFDVSYYQKKTTDQIVPVMISGATGYASKYINAGEMDNKGWEITLNAAPFRNKNFSWDMQFNISTLKNTVVSIDKDLDYLNLSNGPFRVKAGAMVGASYPVIYGTDFVYDDNGNKLINPYNGRYQASAIKNIGNATPTFTAGWSNTFKIYGFDVNILFDMQRGGNMYWTSYMWGMYSGILEESAQFINGKNIRETGIAPDGVYGKLVDDKVVYLDKDGNTSSSPVKADKVGAQEWAEAHYDSVDAQNVFSTNFIKLREARIGYTFPSKWTGPIKNLRISAYGRNLAIFGRANNHFDPEYLQMAGSNAQGIEGGYIPTTRSYGVSLNFNF